MEQSYQRVEVERGIAVAACAIPPFALCPPATEALMGALKIEAGIETAVKVYWNEQQKVWENEVAIRCDLGWFTRHSKFPDFPYEIVIPEEGLLVKEGTRGLLKKQADLVLSLRNGPLSTEATAKQKHAANWSVAWTK